ncbi:MAG: hypothetical protein RIC55_21435 [Pirellulaceae bacterium]
MATVGEVRERLNSLSEAEYLEFEQRFGGAEKTREGYVRAFVEKPEVERKLCYILCLETEQEKQTAAALASAKAAEESARHAAESSHWAGVSGRWTAVSGLIAFAAFVTSILSWLR